MFVAQAEEEILAETAIELDRGAEAVGKTEGTVDAVDDVDEGGWTLEQGDAIGGELRDGLRGKIWKDGDVEGNFVVEEADTATDGGAIVFCGSEDEADAGSGVEHVGRQAVVFETDAEIESETRDRVASCPEDRQQHYFLRRKGENGIAISDFAGERAVFTENANGKIGDGAVVGGAREGVAEGEEMAARESERAKMEGLVPLIEPGVAMLGFEEAAGILFGEKSHCAGLRVGGKKAGVELLDGEKRLDETAAWEDPAIGNGSEEAALAVIVGDGLRIECVDVGVIGVFRIESEDGGEAMGRVDVPIELRLRVDALVDANVVGIGERGSAEVS